MPEAASGAPRETAHGTLKRGMALSELMASHGLDGAQIGEITRLLREYRSPRTLRPGMTMRFSSAPGGAPDRIELALTPDSTLRFARSDSGWSASLEAVPFTVDTVRISGVVRSSLWNAKLGGDVERLSPEGYEELVDHMADIFAWRVDFARDIRPGDVFRAAFERKIRPDGSMRSLRFLALELRNHDRLIEATPFGSAGGRPQYFDADGRSLRGAFLRYPVPFHITSRYSMHRFHPILKRSRPHLGVDFGAPYGTPVHVTASGVVARAGRDGGYGIMIEVRHANGIRTRYAHLSAIAAGVRAGSHVEQDQVIGRVGATGLATGTHLHYEFLQNGVHHDPLTVYLPTAPAVDPSRLADFRRAQKEALALLEGIPIPEEAFQIVATGPRRR